MCTRFFLQELVNKDVFSSCLQTIVYNELCTRNCLQKIVYKELFIQKMVYKEQFTKNC